MARGRKTRPDRLKIIRGTWKPSRSHPPAVPVLPGVPQRPGWLRGAARRLWDVKTGTYSRRSQSVIGCEGILAMYCQLEADIVQRWRQHADVPATLLNTYRAYAAEFYDTPASQHAARSPSSGANPFSAHGRPPGASR